MRNKPGAQEMSGTATTAMRNEIENPMVLGDYYEIAQLCGHCNLCGLGIVEDERCYLVQDALICDRCIQEAQTRAVMQNV